MVIDVAPGNVDAIWAQYIPKATAADPVVFQYGPGLYQTTGWRFGKVNTAGSYVLHQGAGEDQSVIQLVGADGTTATGAIFAGDWAWPSHWGCQNLTLDLNQKNNGPRPVSAINFWGADNVFIDRVKIINFGSPTAGLECFPVIIASPPRTSPNTLAPGPIDWITIDSCVFTSSISGNKDGCSMIAITDTPNGQVSIGPHCYTANCRFLDCRSDFSYLHCVGNVNVQHNLAINSGIFWYAEPAQTQYAGVEVLVDNNVLVGMEKLVYILPHPPQAALWITVGTGNVCAP